MAPILGPIIAPIMGPSVGHLGPTLTYCEPMLFNLAEAQISKLHSYWGVGPHYGLIPGSIMRPLIGLM
jgi:hypothetical protein